MPSKRRKKTKKSIARTRRTPSHIAFFPLVFLTLIMWFIYRSLFTFPVWFDESIGKALFFGLPVWLYILISNLKGISDSFALFKIKRGLMLGIAVGGVFGFIASLLSLVQSGGQVQAAMLFVSDQFWWEFLLALLTAFWETMFFYSLVMVVIQDKFRDWSLLKQILLVAGIFLLFHLPNTVLRFGGVAVAYQLILLFFFAVGQGFLFASEKNAYSLVLSHAIWGMVLLIHF